MNHLVASPSKLLVLYVELTPRRMLDAALGGSASFLRAWSLASLLPVCVALRFHIRALPAGGHDAIELILTRLRRTPCNCALCLTAKARLEWCLLALNLEDESLTYPVASARVLSALRMGRELFRIARSWVAFSCAGALQPPHVGSAW